MDKRVKEEVDKQIEELKKSYKEGIFENNLKYFYKKLINILILF